MVRPLQVSRQDAPVSPHNCGMAKKRAPAATARKVKGTGVVVVSTPAPIARRASGSISRRRKRRSGGRRKGRVGGGTTKNVLIGSAIGGYIFGFVQKQWGAQIPSLPVVGKSGTIALACHFLAPRHPIIRDVGIAAAAIAGFTFARDGAVAGIDDEELAQ